VSLEKKELSQIKTNITRRDFLKLLGITLSGAAFPSAFQFSRLSASVSEPNWEDQHQSTLPSHPNIVIIITDQERYPQHWPVDYDYAAKHPARTALARNGITFRRAYCNSAMCSPSRANLFTGMHPPQHGLDHTLTYNYSLNSLAATEKPMSLAVPNMATMLASAGYRVVLKGKWHLSKHKDGTPPDSLDVAQYGFAEWEPTTAGEATDPEDFGGGCANWDGKIGAQVQTWLQNNAPYDPNNPFALIVSLANPHDLLSYPNTWDSQSATDPNCYNYKTSANFNQGITLPSTINEKLDRNNKPSVQSAALDLYAGVLGTLLSDQNKLNYVNFYADLQIMIDNQIEAVLAELTNQGLIESTVIIRVSDHGEMGLSHGGLRQKMFNAYEETIHIPLVISNPILFPTAVETDALASLVDVMPTIATIASVPFPNRSLFKGQDLTPLFTNPTGSVQNSILFTFDDDRAGTGWVSPNIENKPHHIHAMIHRDADGEWKFARYFNPEGGVEEEYEMYRLKNELGQPDDVNELINLIFDPNWDLKQAELMQILTQIETERLAPLDFQYLPIVTNSGS